VNINNIIIANYRLSENKTYKKMIQTYIAALYIPNTNCNLNKKI
jgi:hypothetical protein